MKTIQELNKKIWYRFLKVIYIFTLLIVILFSIGTIFSSNPEKKEVSSELTTFTCIYGNKKVLTGEKSGFVFIKSRDDYYILDSEEPHLREDLIDFCQITKEEKDLIIDKPTHSLVDIKLGFKKEGGLFVSPGYSLLAVFIILIISEIIRRTFYYISLGKIFPPKDEKGKEVNHDKP